MQKQICAVYGEGAVTDRMCKSGLQSFVLLEVDRDQIETITENNQCCITQEIADVLKISKSIINGLFGQNNI